MQQRYLVSEVAEHRTKLKALDDQKAEKEAEVAIVRNGSRGMHWLEPLVEVVSGGKRLGYGPVDEADVPGLTHILVGGGEAGS